MLVQTTLPEASIETLNKRILGGLAGLDEGQLDTRLLTPEEQGFGLSSPDQYRGSACVADHGAPCSHRASASSWRRRCKPPPVAQYPSASSHRRCSGSGCADRRPSGS